MKSIGLLIFLTCLAVLSGCAAKQTITQFDQSPPRIICIAKHDAVRDGVLNALEEGFHQHGATTQVISATYTEKHNTWNPQINLDEAHSCDAVAFYVANWTWDISMYMYFANIWVTNKDLSQKISQATYQTGGGPDKWINARTKILELVDEMYRSAPMYVAATPQTIEKSQNIHKANPPVVEDDDQIVALRKLKTIYDEGLIDESEYDAKRKDILNNL